MELVGMMYFDCPLEHDMFTATPKAWTGSSQPRPPQAEVQFVPGICPRPARREDVTSLSGRAGVSGVTEVTGPIGLTGPTRTAGAGALAGEGALPGIDFAGKLYIAWKI